MNFLKDVEFGREIVGHASSMNLCASAQGTSASPHTQFGLKRHASLQVALA